MEEKQIEEMAEHLIYIQRNFNEYCAKPCSECELSGIVNCENNYKAEALYRVGYRKQKKGKWEWFEEWNPSTPEHPRECDECGWQCSECKTALEDVIGGYWDDPEAIPNLNFCPECGARMKGA